MFINLVSYKGKEKIVNTDHIIRMTRVDNGYIILFVDGTIMPIKPHEFDMIWFELQPNRWRPAETHDEMG